MGTRIRERRLALGLKQAALARAAGVSPAYLNLIEHNRRAPPAGLVEVLAGLLGSASELLSGGGEEALFAALREAAGTGDEAGPAADGPDPERPELERIEEFVSRFPGWAGLLAARQDRVQHLEQALIALSERLSQDPFLADTLHEVLSAVTSLRSTAAILTEEDGLEPEWRMRFHRSLREDSRRAARMAEALAGYLDRLEGDERAAAQPLDEVEDWLAAQGWQPSQEAGEEALLRAPQLVSAAGRALAGQWLARLRDEARALPEGDLAAAMGAGDPACDPGAAGFDPVELARRLDQPVGRVLRRLGLVLPQAGLLICDAAGVLVLRRAPAGFSLPRLGGACPLLPLFGALAAPGRAVAARLEMAGRAPVHLRALALSELRMPGGLAGPALSEAVMLILPDADPGALEGDVLPVGPGCRICPRGGCLARREPSLTGMGDDLAS